MSRLARRSSLDAFRGLTVAAMILVNHPGNWMAVFPQLQHAPWDGWTFADLVFPFFLAIMGLALPIASARRPIRSVDKTRLYRGIIWRSVELCGLGLVLNLALAWPAWHDTRIPGVLQRIAISYAIAAPLALWGTTAVCLAIAAALLVGHWALLTLIPVNGVIGVVTPDHNLAAVIDRAVFGSHLLTQQTDPEGLIGTLSSIAVVLLGAVAGRWILSGGKAGGRVIGLGVACAVLGYSWGIVWPINKTLWSGSYALLATGLALLAYSMIEVIWNASAGVRRILSPFVWLGMRPLAIYFWSEFVAQALDRPFLGPRRAIGVHDFVFWRWIARLYGDNGGRWSSFTFAAVYVLLWIAVAYLIRPRHVPLQG